MTKFDGRQFTHIDELMRHYDQLPSEEARRALLQRVASRVEAAHSCV